MVLSGFLSAQNRPGADSSGRFILLLGFYRALAEAHEDGNHLSPGGGTQGIQDAAVFPLSRPVRTAQSMASLAQPETLAVSEKSGTL